MEKDIKIRTIIELFIGIFLLACGIPLMVFSSSSLMGDVLGYFIAGIMCILSIMLTIYTFIKTPEKFYLYFVYSLILVSGVYCFITPIAATTFICLYLGVSFMLISLLFFIKFYILKHVSFKHWFNIVQLFILIIIFLLGLALCMFFKTIDVILLCFLIGIPLTIIGLYLIILMSIRLIINH